jgi:hypothetical protein
VGRRNLRINRYIAWFHKVQFRVMTYELRVMS